MNIFSINTASDSPDGDRRLSLKDLIAARYETKFSNIQRVAMTTLGEFYQPLKKFYEGILLSTEYQYIVFVARRSITLAELFYIILWFENPDEKFRARLENSWARATTDSTIMSYSAEIACQLDSHRYPKILIVDDLLIYGNGLNELLYNIEQQVCQELKKNGTHQADDMWQQVVNAITIRVFSQNSQLSVVNLKYQLKLKPEKQMAPKQWHDLSWRISNMIVATGLANATFIMGAELPTETVERSLLLHSFRPAGNGQLFREVSGEKTMYERHYLGWSGVRDGACRYYLSLRAIRNYYTDCYRLMPFVFLPEIPEQAYGVLKEKVFTRWGLLGEEKIVFTAETSSRLEYEAVILHLSESLLRSWSEAADIFLVPENYDSLKVALNLSANRFEAKMGRQMVDRLMDPAYLFTWDELTALLDEATKDAAPLSADASAFTGKTLDIDTELESVVYQFKIQELTESYRYAVALPPEDDRILGFSLRRNLRNNWNLRLEEFLTAFMVHAQLPKLDRVFSKLLSLMDEGAITLKVRQGNWQFTQVLRMGEQSLFLWPQKYSMYLPLLSILEERKIRFDSDVASELNAFLKHEEAQGRLAGGKKARELSKELMKYLESLHKSGQTLDDWDIRFERPVVIDSDDEQTTDQLRQFYYEERIQSITENAQKRTLFLNCLQFYPF